MKISKSFKIYIHILLVFLISKNVLADTDFSKNIVIYEKPKTIGELKFKDLNLQEVDLTNKKGNIMILNFWATWCAPCIDEMPSLDKLQSLFDVEHLKIMSIATGRNSQKKITEFFNKNMLFNLENFIDPRGNLALQLGILGLPASILISPDGHELARLIGPINWIEPNVVKFFGNLTQ